MPAPKYADGHAWALGQQGELAVRNWYLHAGWYVVPLHAIETGGAPMLLGQLRRHVLPDLQVVQGGRLRWVEVKSKTYSPWHARARCYTQGIDLWKWQAYLAVEAESGAPGYLAFVILRPGPDAPIRPMLLLASLAWLREVAQIHRGDDGFVMVFFPVDEFERFDLPIMDVSQLGPLEPRAGHPWERGRVLTPRQPRLRYDMPGAHDRECCDCPSCRAER